MKSDNKLIFLKITGETITNNQCSFNTGTILNLAKQIKALESKCQFGLMVGGGNIFRGYSDGEISANTGHTVGMFATVINALILQDILNQAGVKNIVFSAVGLPEAGAAITNQNIYGAKSEGQCMIFAGGTGNPYFTTDTAAVIRALQIEAKEIWKGTKVDGIYEKDPKKFPDSKLIKKLSYKDALDKELGIMDLTAINLAKQNNIAIRVFDIFQKDSLVNAFNNQDYGSLIS